MAKVSIRKMNDEDWNAVREIYQEGIATGNATFQMAPPEWQEWDSGHLRECRYVACVENNVAGWAALSPYSRRNAYRGVAELSIYVGSGYQGSGVGKALLTELVRGSEKAGFWTLLAGIFPENQASIALHLSLGFREVGCREKVGEMHGVWRDVLIYERRSRAVCY
ncbi:phosphinothricin acetyltransferase [Pantoea agglomerans]|uniref:GNAT family N-acetyltransferase n=1 Tax=Enterobacter agglomerans TaxID=549 RepID=UPI0015FA6990|nr:GNAT family N-acetyltransferase [Pantoea agglomerans]MBA8867131.1 phosphinothricin acetyltransferase [Pantoea agglomerans]MBA8894315.1 phosphinothricin acetyltransferase [Pantoea agglomerans]UVV75403.1 GNAT family N-acetyltransferase [Pantoea agglomerans]WEC75209.1 N-acetyltransferase family protein [Pantoea agglomerans]WNK38001.1 GNAT family N-acetyltransferase [Pantoea agglomerans]